MKREYNVKNEQESWNLLKDSTVGNAEQERTVTSFTEPGHFDCGDKKSLNSFCPAIGDASVKEDWRG